MIQLCFYIKRPVSLILSYVVVVSLRIAAIRTHVPFGSLTFSVEESFFPIRQLHNLYKSHLLMPNKHWIEELGFLSSKQKESCGWILPGRLFVS